MRLFPRVRNAMFSVQCVFFAAMMGFMGPRFFPLCAAFGAAGVGVLILTLMTRDTMTQKASFLAAGGAGAAALLTVSIFHVLLWSGRPPSGDGGGFTVPMLLIVCPVVFLMGAVGVGLCRIATAIAGTKNIVQ